MPGRRWWSPYRGLQAFREEDAAYFFGRDDLKVRLWAQLRARRGDLADRPVGFRQSSLLNAGLLPHLRRDGRWRLIRLRPGDRPMQRLGEDVDQGTKARRRTLELADRAIELRDKLTSDPDRLPGYARTFQDAKARSLCLIVDQFEETFTLAAAVLPAEHDAFLATLTSSLARRRTRRGEGGAGVEVGLPDYAAIRSAAAELVAALDGDPTVSTAAAAAARAGAGNPRAVAPSRWTCARTDGLLAQLLHDIARDADALPLLEFALTELWAGMRIDREGDH